MSVPRPRIPDYDAFCRVAEEHAGQWEITYDYDAVEPYRARHRVDERYRIATSELGLLAHLLRASDPPPYARRYLETAGQEPRGARLETRS